MKPVRPYQWTLIALNVGLGLCRLLESPHRTATPSYLAAHEVLHDVGLHSMRWWAVPFLVVAFLVATVHHRRRVTIGAWLGLIVWSFWTVMVTTSAVQTGEASFSGAVLYCAAAVRHYQAIPLREKPLRIRRTA